MLAGRWIAVVIANRWNKKQSRNGRCLEVRLQNQIKFAFSKFAVSQDKPTFRKAGALLAEFLDDRGHFERLVLTTRSFYEITIKIQRKFKA